MAAGHEAAAEVLVVVDLPVEDDDFGAVLVENRLLAAAQVDDAQTAHPEANGPVHVEPLVVWAAVPERGAHPTHSRLRHGTLPLAVHNACDAAHVWTLQCT